MGRWGLARHFSPADAATASWEPRRDVTLVLSLLSFPVALLCSTLISLLNMSAGESGSGQLLFSELFQFPPLSLSYS